MRISFQFTVLVAVATAASLVLAGPIAPPQGPVASTSKTLDEVEPSMPVESLPGDPDATHVITQSGAYHLTDNLIGEFDKSGIRIEADDVLLDLRGFALIGDANSSQGDGIAIGVGPPCLVRVQNGSIRGWAENGVHLEVEGNLVVDHLDISAVGAAGLVGPAMITNPAELIGPMFIVQNSMIHGVGGDGINTGLLPSFTIENTTIEDVGLAGLVGPAMNELGQFNVAFGPIGLIEHCIIRGTGLEAIRAGDIVTVRQNDIAGPVSLQTEAVLENNELWLAMDHPVSMGLRLEGGLHKLRWNRIRFTPAPGGNVPAVEIFGDGVSYVENDLMITDWNNQGSLPAVMRVTGDGGEIKNSAVQGIQSSTIGIQVIGDAWILSGNDLAGLIGPMFLVGIDVAGNSNIVVRNTLRSGGNDGALVQINGLKNIVGPTVDQQSILTNTNPDRNILGF